MRLRALLETDALGLRLLGGEDELDRTVRGVMTTDLRDPSRYLSGGELVLTGLAWHRDPEDSEPFVRILAGAGVAGLAAGEAELGDIPADLVDACRRHRLPLFAGCTRRWPSRRSPSTSYARCPASGPGTWRPWWTGTGG
ncbi:hypothetical protein SCALM49S_02158 [Streptomyces californicus]